MSHRHEDKSGGGVSKKTSSGGSCGVSGSGRGGDGSGGHLHASSVRLGEKRPVPPPAPIISGSKSSSSSVGVKKPKLAFSIGKKPELSNNSLKRPQDDKSQGRSALRQAFNSDSEEEEEIPREVRMRMRNFGRDTPTSSGPNSFGKTKQGFCDAKHMFEKKLRAAAEKVTK